MAEAETLIARKIQSAELTAGQMPMTQETFKDYVKLTEHGARRYLSTVVEAIIVEAEVRSFSSVLDAVTMPTMIGVCSIDDTPSTALAILDPALTFHLVDVLLGGDPEDSDAFAARKATAMDCALCQKFIDTALDAFAEAVRCSFTDDHFRSMKCTSFEHTPLMANILPEYAEVLFIRMDLDIGEAARLGKMDLIVPLSMFDLVRAASKKRAADVGGSTDADPWLEHMINVVTETPLDMTAEIHQARYSVAELSKLDVDDVLPIATEALENVRLKLDVPGGELQIAAGKLGAVDRFKALKLSGVPNRAFLRPIEDLRKHGVIPDG